MSGDSPISGNATPSSGLLDADRPPPSKDVFVSYASQDAPVADAVVEALESQGISCWIAPRDVTPGELYAGVIVHAIDAAKATVLILSQHSGASPHVVREVERAASKRHPVISLRIDRAPLPADLEYFLNTSQWLNAGEGESSRVFPRLVEAVRKALSPAPSMTGSGSAGSPLPALNEGHASKRSFNRPLVGGLIVMASLGFAIDKFWLSMHAGTEKPVSQTSVPVAFAPPPHSIAVLPFVNMSGDAGQEYFSDGITEELLNSLSRLNELQVVARTSSFSFKGQNVDVSTIAHKLNVGAILEGSVRRAGKTVRVTVQLIDGVTGFHRWSQTYDRNLTDILEVQTEVASSVARELQVKLGDNEAAQIELGGTRNPDAFEAYLRGIQLYYMPDAHEKDYRSALAVFDQAITLDPNYAAAYARRAGALMRIYYQGHDERIRAQLHSEARQAAVRAVALAPQLGEAHLALAFTLIFGDPNFVAASRELDLAVALSPGSAWVQRNYAENASAYKHFDSALSAAHHAVRLDPQNAWSYDTLGEVLVGARRFPEALTALNAGRVLEPSARALEADTAFALLGSRQYEIARQLCQGESTHLEDDDRHSCLALALRGLERHVDARHEREKFEALQVDGGAYKYAQFYARWGDNNTALQWLTKAVQLRDPQLMYIQVDWMLDPIRKQPQFKAIEAQLNFPP